MIKFVEKEFEMDAHRFLKFWQNIQRVDVYWKEGFDFALVKNFFC